MRSASYFLSANLLGRCNSPVTGTWLLSAVGPGFFHYIIKCFSGRSFRPFSSRVRSSVVLNFRIPTLQLDGTVHHDAQLDARLEGGRG
ncbi:hypothetical protein BDR03DRAFT_968123 [Suillus americanus]|nr:hypothetical protein BDR03DRAFT_968123 [Suillus americanus]